MRPASIVNFERVVILSIILSVVQTILQWDRMAADAAASGVGISLLVTADVIGLLLYLLFIWLIAWRGSNVARWIYTVLVAIGLAYSAVVFAQGRFGDDNVALMFSVVQIVLTVVSIWLLFRPDANAWFRSEEPADPDVFS